MGKRLGGLRGRAWERDGVDGRGRRTASPRVRWRGVARTIRKATAALREEGLIVTTPGMGSFVRDRSGEEPR